MYQSFNTTFYNRAVTFVSSPIGITFLVVWSFCEASFWFIAPDFLLVMFAFLKPTHKNKFFAVAFKIWTHIAVVMGLNPIIYFPLVTISRVFRLYPVTWLSAYVSRYATNFLKNNFLVVLASYVILFFTMLVVLEN